ncbi:hypothetical protein BY458DRAFT_446167 [Sporodiniella umbellata]|nr:hypothetical protein BY458DRAFT_446167 [Sporodiniella umbellata]
MAPKLGSKSREEISEYLSEYKRAMFKTDLRFTVLSLSLLKISTGTTGDHLIRL